MKIKKATIGDTVPRKYQKVNIVHEAMQWDGTEEGAEHIIKWVRENIDANKFSEVQYPQYEPLTFPVSISYGTVYGIKHMIKGDWVILPFEGADFFSLNSEMFENRYEYKGD